MRLVAVATIFTDSTLLRLRGTYVFHVVRRLMHGRRKVKKLNWTRRSLMATLEEVAYNFSVLIRIIEQTTNPSTLARDLAYQALLNPGK